MRPMFAGVRLTETSLEAARQFFDDAHLATFGRPMTPEERARPSFALLQRACFIQTGKAPGLLGD